MKSISTFFFQPQSEAQKAYNSGHNLALHYINCIIHSSTDCNGSSNWQNVLGKIRPSPRAKCSPRLAPRLYLRHGLEERPHNRSGPSGPSIRVPGCGYGCPTQALPGGLGGRRDPQSHPRRHRPTRRPPRASIFRTSYTDYDSIASRLTLWLDPNQIHVRPGSKSRQHAV